MPSQYDTRERKNGGLPPDNGNPSKKNTRFFRRKTAFLPLDEEINYFCSDFYCIKTLTTMETKQQTDENTETPLNTGNTNTHAQKEGVENNTEREDNGDSDIKSDDLETDGLKEENAKKLMENKPSDIPVSINKKWSEWIKSNPLTTLLITVIAGLIVIAVPKIVVYFRCYTKPYITFESDFTQVFQLSDKSDKYINYVVPNYVVPNLEYSVGESRWKALGDQIIVFGGNRGKLMLRGKNRRGTGIANISFATDAQVICTGDIRTLVDYKHYQHTDTEQAVFASLFEGCSQLVVAPELPATALANRCYSNMFFGCTSLKRPPELPATALADSCYSGMFFGCTSLKRALELPATTLAEDCYSDMFRGCTSLKRPPELPAMALANRCYSDMFYGCTSLETPPKLPATALAVGCYRYMFFGCTSLKRAPELPATTLANRCYSNMFFRCTSLKIVPELPATALAEGCYSDMFRGCTSLERAPKLPATALAEGCYSDMFRGCTSLERPPELPATALAVECYRHMFFGCISLKRAPELHATALAQWCYDRMFSGCTSLSSVTMMAVGINKGDFYHWLDGTSTSGRFYKNKNAQWSNDGIVPENWKVELIP